MPKRIAIIGAGPSGLAAIKSCKEEELEVVCFEKTTKYGGTWCNPKSPFSSGNVSLFSKEMNAFSDFPPPKSMPNYMPRKDMMKYITLYVHKFQLQDHIKFNEEVVHIEAIEDLSSKGRWLVVTNNVLTSERTEMEFDGVIICTGRRTVPRTMNLPDQRFFRGNIAHCWQLDKNYDFADLNVLIVGFGNTAVDIAINCSTSAKQVYLSTTSGGWTCPRAAHRGLPSDMIFLRRSTNVLQNLWYNKTCDYIEKAINRRFNHEMYKVRPSHRILDRFPIVSDDLPDKVLTGRVIIKGPVQKLVEHGAMFKGESEVIECDLIILVAGYNKDIPLLKDEIWKSRQDQQSLYKLVFPTNKIYQTLAIIGQIEPLGPRLPVVELQCRWAASVLSGRIALPSQRGILEEMGKSRRCLSNRFKGADPLYPEVDYIHYMDELATVHGSMPSFKALFMKDRGLYWAFFTGPYLPYQFRLCGPHADGCARQNILRVQERVVAPFRNISDGSIVKEAYQPNYIFIACMAFLCLTTLYV